MASIYETIRAGIATNLGANAPPVLIGMRALHEHAAPPRVVLVFRGGDWGPPGNVGRQLDGASSSKRQLWTRTLRCDVYCWANGNTEDAQREAVDRLVENVAVAVRRFCAAVPREDELLADTDEVAAWLKRGQAALLRLEIPLQVHDEIIPLTTIDGFIGDFIAELPAGDELVLNVDYLDPNNI